MDAAALRRHRQLEPCVQGEVEKKGVVHTLAFEPQDGLAGIVFKIRQLYCGLTMARTGRHVVLPQATRA